MKNRYITYEIVHRIKIIDIIILFLIINQKVIQKIIFINSLDYPTNLHIDNEKKDDIIKILWKLLLLMMREVVIYNVEINYKKEENIMKNIAKKKYCYL